MCFSALIVLSFRNSTNCQNGAKLKICPLTSGCSPPVCLSPFPVVAVVISTFCFLLLSDDWDELGERTKRVFRFKASLINIFTLTMGQRTVCTANSVGHSDKPTENYHSTQFTATAIPPSSTSFTVTFSSLFCFSLTAFISKVSSSRLLSAKMLKIVINTFSSQYLSSWWRPKKEPKRLKLTIIR